MELKQLSISVYNHRSAHKRMTATVDRILNESNGTTPNTVLWAKVQRQDCSLLGCVGMTNINSQIKLIIKADNALSKDYQMGQATIDQYLFMLTVANKVPMKFLKPAFWTSRTESERQGAAGIWGPGWGSTFKTEDGVILDRDNRRIMWQDRLDLAIRYQAAAASEATGSIC